MCVFGYSCQIRSAYSKCSEHRNVILSNKNKTKSCKSNGGISLALFAQKAIAGLEGDVTEPRILFQWEKALQEMLQLLDYLVGTGWNGLLRESGPAPSQT